MKCLQRRGHLWPRRFFMKTFLKVSLLVGAIGYLVALVLLDPEEHACFWHCPFYMLTGLKCAGCGGQRAVHWLFQGDYPRAFAYNPLAVSVAPVYALLYFVKGVSRSVFYWYGWVVLVLGFMVVRNLPLR